MAERLAFHDVGDVHLDHRDFDPTDGIGQGDGSVRVATGIDHNSSVLVKPDGMKRVDQCTFVIRLQVRESVVRKPWNQSREVVFKRLGSIDFRFPFSKKIQVGAVDDMDAHSTNSRVEKSSLQ